MSVSVVIPAYNARRWIVGAINSIRAQVPRPMEIIVVDDGSSDGTAEVVRSFGKDILLLVQQNKGASIARNLGLSKVSSLYVFFLDADDYVEGEFLAGAEAVLSRERADIAFSPVLIEKPDGSRTKIFHYSQVPKPNEVFSCWLDYYSQPPCSVVWRTEFVRRIGGWNPDVTLNDDGELMMRAMLHGPILSSFLNGNGVYRAHSAPSLSKMRSLDALEREFRAMKNLMQLAMDSNTISDFSGFGRKLYFLARGFFEMGCVQLGRLALFEARSVGLRGHPGTLNHQLLSSILGLEAKSKLAHVVRKTRIVYSDP